MLFNYIKKKFISFLFSAKDQKSQRQISALSLREATDTATFAPSSSREREWKALLFSSFMEGHESFRYNCWFKREREREREIQSHTRVTQNDASSDLAFGPATLHLSLPCALDFPHLRVLQPQKGKTFFFYNFFGDNTSKTHFGLYVYGSDCVSGVEF